MVVSSGSSWPISNVASALDEETSEKEGLQVYNKTEENMYYFWWL